MSDIQPRFSFDRSLLIPIAIGVVSILGIGWILLTSDLGNSLLSTTAIPSSISPLAVETPSPAPPATPTEAEPAPTATEAGPEAYPGPPAETLPSISTMITVTESPTTPPATPTPDSAQLLQVGKHDDTHPNIAYGRYWTALKNPGTENAYLGTLHASNGIGNEASFRFTGEQVRLGYQRGRSFGAVTVIIDGQSYSFHEQAFDLVWRSPPLSPGVHEVRIIHESGQSINLDYIEILD